MTGDLLGQRGIYPIRSFVSKNDNGDIDVDCRINAVDWQQGRCDLYAHAQHWEIENDFLAWKQYILIVPIEVEDLESENLKQSLKDNLRKELEKLQQKQPQTAQEPEQKRKWWKFWG